MSGTDQRAALYVRWIGIGAAMLLAACDSGGVHPDGHDAARSGGDAALEGEKADAGTGRDGPDASGPTVPSQGGNAEASVPAQGPGRDAGGSGGPAQADASSSNGKPDASTTNDKPDAGAPVDAATSMTAACDRPGLAWKSAKKTNYESYPAPGSDECVKFNGCAYLGQFQACENTMPESWVKSHNIAAVFPLQGLALHNLCVRSGGKTLVVTAIDTCGDSDCGGCCTKNRGAADRLIDLEKYTNQRFGVADGDIEWADLGAGDPGFDGCNAP